MLWWRGGGSPSGRPHHRWKTGLRRELSDTVMLRNIWKSESLTEECLCYGQLGDCPRGEVMYWREIWLECLSEKTIRP
jgi:hypothetical protein